MNEYKIILQTTVDGNRTEIVTLGEVTKEYGGTNVSFTDAESGDKTKIVINDEVVSVLREGEMSSVLTFDKNEETKAVLVTPYGSMPLVLKTSFIKSEIQQNLLKVKINYTTEMQDEISRFEVELFAEREIER